jgi:hypothetical protein
MQGFILYFSIRDTGEVTGIFYLGVFEQQRLRITGLWKIHIAFDIERLN